VAEEFWKTVLDPRGIAMMQCWVGVVRRGCSGFESVPPEGSVSVDSSEYWLTLPGEAVCRWKSLQLAVVGTPGVLL